MKSGRHASVDSKEAKMRFSGPIKLKDLVKQWEAGWHCEDRAGFTCTDLHTETHTHINTPPASIKTAKKTAESPTEEKFL